MGKNKDKFRFEGGKFSGIINEKRGAKNVIFDYPF